MIRFILQGIIQNQPLSADEAQSLYDERQLAEKTLAEQRQIEEEKIAMRNEVLMRYNESLREVTTATKQINDKVQWLSSTLGTKFTTLDHAKDGKVDIDSVEELRKQSVALKVCVKVCLWYCIYIAALPTPLNMYLLRMNWSQLLIVSLASLPLVIGKV